jgi:hypothetical protein
MKDDRFCSSCGAALYTPYTPPQYTPYTPAHQEAPKKSSNKVLTVIIIISLIVVAAAAAISFTLAADRAEVTINVYPMYEVKGVTIYIDGKYIAEYTGTVEENMYLYYKEIITFREGENSKTITVTASSGSRSDTQILFIEKGKKYSVDLFI